MTQTEQILEDINESAKTYAKIGDQFIHDFVFYGKSLAKWADELAIPVPQKTTPEQLRHLYVKLANNLQIATHFYSVSNSMNTGLTSGTQVRKAKIISRLQTEYEQKEGKKPAAATLERMAQAEMSDAYHNKIAASIIKDFWRDQLNCLTELRKCLESISVNMISEMKYLHIAD